MGQGGGAGAVARGCARAAAARRGGAGPGLGLALLGLAWSVVRWTLPGSGDWDVGTRQLSSHAPPRLAESRLVPGPAAQAGVKFPLIWGLGAGVAAG